MATYDVSAHEDVDLIDIKQLPDELKDKFSNRFYQRQLSINPIKPKITPSFKKFGRLKDCRALHIEWNGDSNAYRLVYRILENPAPKRVEILSFARHEKNLNGIDPPYFRAQKRLGRLPEQKKKKKKKKKRKR